MKDNSPITQLFSIIPLHSACHVLGFTIYLRFIAIFYSSGSELSFANT